MPGQARIDAPGALHPIIGRGIDRQEIFSEDADYDLFSDRRGSLPTEIGTRCVASITTARSLLCFWAVDRLALPQNRLAQLLDQTPSAIGHAVQRGNTLAEKNGYELLRR
jgi:hypothetical protein